MDNKALRLCVEELVARYINDLDGNFPADGIYDLVIREMEIALYSSVYKMCGLNQSTATKVLGISRATFRHKAEIYNLLVPKSK